MLLFLRIIDRIRLDKLNLRLILNRIHWHLIIIKLWLLKLVLLKRLVLLEIVIKHHLLVDLWLGLVLLKIIVIVIR